MLGTAAPILRASVPNPENVMASNFLPALGDAVRDRICPVLGGLSYINDAITAAGGGEPARAPILPLASALNRIFCDQPPPPIPPAPFNGGQCPNVRYDVAGYVDSETLSGTLPSRTNWAVSSVLGPIRQAQRVQGDFTQALILGGGGAELVVDSVNNNFRRITEFRVLSVVANPAAPDDCGNPPPDIPPTDPADVTFDFDLTYNDINNNTVNIPIVLVFGFAQVTANGQVNIPFKVDVNGEFNLNGTIDANGEVNFGVAFPGSNIETDIRIEGCRDLFRPDGETPEDPEDDLLPEQPNREEERVIKGVLVTVTDIDLIKSSVIAQDENPDIYVPSLGHVNFLCRVGAIAGGWTTDIQVKNRRHLIQCPWEGGAVEVRGTPQPGVTWVLTPVYGYAESPVQYPVGVSQ